MRRLAPLFLLCGVAACDPPPQRDIDDSAMEAPELMPQRGDTVWPDKPDTDAQPEGQPVSTLVGEWRLAGINGRELMQNYGVAVSIGAKQIRADSQCVKFWWDYTLDEEGAFSATPANQDEPVCERGRTPDEEALAAALPKLTHAVRLPSNALQLSGGGASITLFTQ